MSGAVASMVSDAGSGPIALSTMSVRDFESGGNPILASISVNRSGTITFIGNASSSNTAWYSPTGGTPGDAYYVSMTLDSGDSWTTGAATSGTGIAITADRAWDWSFGGPNIKEAVCTLRIATDSGMTNVVSSATVNVEMESAL